MRNISGIAASIALAVALTVLAACGAGAAAHAPTPVPTSTPYPTSTATLAVPSHAITFTTSDHLQLSGTLFGHGQTFVIFSNQTDTYSWTWAPIAQQFAARGYSALCYDYRGHGASQGDKGFGPGMLTDLRAAITFAQQQGAQHIVLVGASIGGAITANVAATTSTPLAAVAMVSAPSAFPQLEVSAATMTTISAPKLIMETQYDDYAQDAQTMYDEASQPKQLHIYPGADHGIDLLLGDNSPDAMRRLITFVQQSAPAQA